MFDFLNANLPVLDLRLLSFIRFAHGLLLILWLLQLIPVFRLYFLDEHQGGYIQNHSGISGLHRSGAAHVVFGFWLVSIAMFSLNVWPLYSGLFNLFCCYYYFIFHRWTSLSRGFGAPGFVSFWMSAALYLLVFISVKFPHLMGLALFTVQFDFAIIILSSGISKMTSGYRNNEGIQYGIVNPLWSYWPQISRKITFSGTTFYILNQMAWIGQVVFAILAIYPTSQFFAGLLIIAMFLPISLTIRLGVLSWQVILCGFFYLYDIPLVEIFSGGFLFTNSIGDNPYVAVLLLSYILIRPFATVGLWYNFYGNKTLRFGCQKLLEKYTNFFGIILWRVFTRDVLDFYVKIEKKDSHGDVQLLSHYSRPLDMRFNSVHESIVLACIFTALKYYSDRTEIFEERLSRYIKTLPHSNTDRIEITFYGIFAEGKDMAIIPLWLFTGSHTRKLEKQVLNAAGVERYTLKSINSTKKGAHPGSYAPSSSGGQ